MTDCRPLASIVIGERHRSDLGDIRGLADSIQANGLLHPIVVTADGTLVAGQRRMEACRLLGWTEVPVTVVDVDDLLLAERDENQERKDFTPTEAVAIGRVIEDRERPAAEASRRAGQRRGAARPADADVVGDSPTSGPHQVRRIAADAVGMSEFTYHRAKAVVIAAEEDPERFGDLPERMDETGNISGTHRELARRQILTADNVRALPVQGTGRKPPSKPALALVTNAVIGVTVAAEHLARVDIDALPADHFEEWDRSLTAAAKSLRKFQAQLKRGTDGSSDVEAG